MTLFSELVAHQNVVLETFDDKFISKIQFCGEHIGSCLERGGKIMFMGNGGSAADSQHFSAEFISKLSKDRGALPALALTVDTSALTAIGNDYGFDKIFERQLSALCTPNDVVVGISTSGKSINVIKGLQIAKVRGATTIGFSGISGIPDLNLDYEFRVKSKNTARIQECHLIIGHMLCKVAEKNFD